MGGEDSQAADNQTPVQTQTPRRVDQTSSARRFLLGSPVVTTPSHGTGSQGQQAQHVHQEQAGRPRRKRIAPTRHQDYIPIGEIDM